MIRSLVTALPLFCFVLTTPLSSEAETPLEKSYSAHGGLETWKKQGAVSYDMQWGPPGNEEKTIRDHQVFDLIDRNGKITAEDYTIVSNGDKVWYAGENVAGGRPARFYLWTPFYFFALPFAFGDPGVNIESLGMKEFQAKNYEAVRVTYDSGVGDTPDDYYVAYIDPETGQLKLVYYIVTYEALVKQRAGKPASEHAMVYEQWQEVDGLNVPKMGAYYKWIDGDISGEPLGRMTVTNVAFSEDRPAPETFTKPEGAKLDESHK